MNKQEIEASGVTLEDARKQLERKIPKGLSVLSETVLSDGQNKSIQESAATMDEAFKLADSKIPAGVPIVERKELFAPEEKLVTVQAFDENAAKHEAKLLTSDFASVISLSVLVPAKKGFLGIGKKPATYEIKMHQPAVVRIIYKQEARIRASVGEKPKCDRCGKSSSFLLPVQLQTKDGSMKTKDLQLCSDCFTEASSGAVGMRFE